MITKYKDRIIPEKGILLGEATLTPIQCWFFNRNWNNVHHFNQSALFEVNKSITLSILKLIFNVISQYHDVLRMRYKKEGDKYIQYYSDEVIEVSEKFLLGEDSEKLSNEIYNDSTTIQRSLNIFLGPIIKVVLYKCPDKKNRVLMVAHHLVIDGVSWRIIRDDLETIYKEILKGGKISLPAKTHSYRQWGNILLQYSNSVTIQEESKYWEDIAAISSELSLEADSTGKSEVRDMIDMSFTDTETYNLLYKLPKAFNAQINDILLSALTLAIGDINNNYSVSFILEGHGREDVIGLDVTRTVGWFTSIFPVYLKIQNPHDLMLSVQNVKKQLAIIPNKGIGYGIIRYYKHILNTPLPKISFNYLGQWDTGLTTNEVFHYAKETPGNDCDERNESSNLIDINCYVKSSRFRMWLNYNTSYYKLETMKKFITFFRVRILNMIEKVVI